MEKKYEWIKNYSEKPLTQEEMDHDPLAQFVFIRIICSFYFFFLIFLSSFPLSLPFSLSLFLSFSLSRSDKEDDDSSEGGERSSLYDTLTLKEKRGVLFGKKKTQLEKEEA